jgi:tetratricopeptide (TPR) repeat protein
MLAYPLQPSLASLLREVAEGNPVLVFLNLGTSWFPKWHFAVVVGYDLASREIILRSGTTRRWHTTLAVLERTWSRSGYWALVILPAGNIPASARADRYLQAAHDLEASNQTSAAMSAYQAAIQHWPDEPHAWMAYGNGLYTSGDYPQAETAFRKATTLAPKDAQGWNNLAYALLKTACPRQARQAAACAASLAPTVANYRNTVAEINALADGTSGQHCRPVDCELAINPL